MCFFLPKFLHFLVFASLIVSSIHASDAQEAALSDLDKNLITPVIPAKVLNSMHSIWRNKITTAAESAPLCSPDENPAKVTSVPFALTTLAADASLTFRFGDRDFLVDFKPLSVLIRLTNPENDLERSGVMVPFSRDSRWIFLNAAGAFDLAAFIPPVTECARQFIVACPRVLKPQNVLAPLPLPESMRPNLSFKVKADATIVSPDSSAAGLVRVSARTTANSRSLKNWQAFKSGTRVSAKVHFDPEVPDEDEPEEILEAIQIDEGLPFTSAIETRADYFIPESGLRSESLQIIYSVEKVEQPSALKIFPKGITARLEPGSCLMISKHTVVAAGEKK